MSNNAEPIYTRGKYWLGWDTNKAGARRSPNLTIFWYDAARRRVRSSSTGTTSESEAMTALDRLYLAQDGRVAYCHSCGQPIASGQDYKLADAIADYRTEVSDARSSSVSIFARLKHVLDYMAAERLNAVTCNAITDAWIGRFRIWSAAQPVKHRNGRGEVTVTRPRSPATTEESVIAVKAVLNHAKGERRIERAPDFKHLPRKAVSSSIKERIKVEMIAAMLTYAAAEPSRRALHRFLIGSICTLARPDAVVDISTDPRRGQWIPGADAIDLNPKGRTQTKKHRPVLPVPPLLAHWLDVTIETAHAKKDPSGGWLVNYRGQPVKSVETAWKTMLEAVGLTDISAHQPYVVRRSMATLCRNRGATAWDLAGQMGHSIASTTEDYAISELYPTAQLAIAKVIEELQKLCPEALHRNGTGKVDRGAP